MIWLEYLESINTCFSIEILQRNDSVLFTKTLKNNQITIILDGFVQILKIFTNGEIICTQLLKTNNTIALHYPNDLPANYYYKATAITNTVILVIPTQELRQKKIQIQELIRIFKITEIYQNTIQQILCHKNTKKRIIQLLLILSEEFGHIKKQRIIIPFYLSHHTLSTITGSHRVNITRIMNDLKHNGLISYNSEQLIIYNILKLSQY